jgi:hypothetical protein
LAQSGNAKDLVEIFVLYILMQIQNAKVEWRRVGIECTPIRIVINLVASIFLVLFVTEQQPMGTVRRLSFETLRMFLARDFHESSVSNRWPDTMLTRFK